MFAVFFTVYPLRGFGAGIVAESRIRGGGGIMLAAIATPFRALGLLNRPGIPGWFDPFLAANSNHSAGYAFRDWQPPEVLGSLR